MIAATAKPSPTEKIEKKLQISKPLFSILNPQFSIFNPQFSIFNPQFSINPIHAIAFIYTITYSDDDGIFDALRQYPRLGEPAGDTGGG